jgi:putative transposase
MSRPLRIDRDGGCYHVTARGNERRAIYRDETDRLKFLELLAEQSHRFWLLPWGYVLMNNHYHLGLETSEPNLSRAMQWLNVSYSVWFNRRHHRSGHLFQGRFEAVLVDWEHWGLELVRYMHLNPVRVGKLGWGKVERERHRWGAGQGQKQQTGLTRLELLNQYRWSSYQATIGEEKAPAWLNVPKVLVLNSGHSLRQRQQAYQAWVERAMWEGLTESPWGQLRGQVVLGSEEFVEELGPLLQGNRREQGALQQLKVRPTWEEVVRVVEGLKGEQWASFVNRYKDWGRDLALYVGRKSCGLKLAELGQRAGGIDYATVSNRIRQFEAAQKEDANLKNIIKQALHCLEKIKI